MEYPEENALNIYTDGSISTLALSRV